MRRLIVMLFRVNHIVTFSDFRQSRFKRSVLKLFGKYYVASRVYIPNSMTNFAATNFLEQ